MVVVKGNTKLFLPPAGNNGLSANGGKQSVNGGGQPPIFPFVEANDQIQHLFGV